MEATLKIHDFFLEKFSTSKEVSLELFLGNFKVSVVQKFDFENQDVTLLAFSACHGSEAKKTSALRAQC